MHDLHFPSFSRTQASSVLKWSGVDAAGGRSGRNLPSIDKARRLCYVYIMFPATTATPFCRKRSAPWDFDHCSPYIKFCYVLLSFLTVCHGIRDAPLGERD